MSGKHDDNLSQAAVYQPLRHSIDYIRAEQPVPKSLRWTLPVITAGCSLGVMMGRGVSQEWLLWMMVFLSTVVAKLVWKQGRLLGVGLMALFLGALLGYGTFHPSLPAEGEVQVTGVISSEIRIRGRQLSARLSHVQLNGQKAGDAYWTCYLNKETSSLKLLPGQEICFNGRVYHPSGALNPDGFDYCLYLQGQGMGYGISGAKALCRQGNRYTFWSLPAVLRHALTEQFRSVLGDSAGEYAAALVLGARDGIPQEERVAFRRLGIAHLLAVSGFHVGVLAALISVLLKNLHAGRKARLILLALVLAGYVWLTGGSPSVVRAAVMLILAEMSRWLHRPRCDLHVMCLSLLVTILLQPAQLWSASLHLTYGAVFGILATSPIRHRAVRGVWAYTKQPLGRCAIRAVEFFHLDDRPKALKWWHHTMPNKVDGWITGVVSGAGVTLGAMLGTVLPQLCWFDSLPLFSFVTNLLLVPLFTLFIFLCWIMGLVMWLPVVGPWTGTGVAWYAGWILGIVRSLGSWGGLEWWLRKGSMMTAAGWLLMVLFTTGFLLIRKPCRLVLSGIGAVLILVSMLPPVPGDPTYLQLAVGNADAAVIQSCGQVTVVDAGETGRELAAYLHQRHLPIDSLILTHLHTDHAGGVRGLLDQGIPVKKCYISDTAFRADIDPGMENLLTELAQSGTTMVQVNRGDEIPLSGGTLRVLWPVRGMTRPGQDANASSLVMHMDIRGTTMLLTGDMDGLYECYAAPQVHILKVAHHGSGASTGEAYRTMVSPQLLLLSGADRKRYTITRKRFPSLPLYQTGRHGAVQVTFREGEYETQPLLNVSPMEVLEEEEVP